ncbi:MAG: proline--tRNA ligase [Elusimicrobiota bacterium]
MKLSRYLVPTLREAPADADNISAQLMVRAGMVRKVAAGIYDWLPLGLRVLKKVENIVRREMDRADGQEVWLPVIQPKKLWERTGRWGVYGKELLRIKDRKNAWYCFAPTAEEVITDLVHREVRSWRQLPLMLYQFGLKFRDEIRPRFGVMRAREFLMKDAYSFHTDDEDASAYYQTMHEAYTRVFTRCGLKFRSVEAQAGAIGGNFSHEFMVLAETGEETIVSCTKCDFAANIERAECRQEENSGGAAEPVEEVATPGKTSVAEVAAQLQASPRTFLKTQLYLADGRPVMALVRGDHELNEAKFSNLLGGARLDRANEAQYEEITGCPVGFAGPVNLPRWKTPDGKMEQVRLYGDLSIQGLVNTVSGANKKDFHLKNINVDRDFTLEAVADLRQTRLEDPCPRCGAATTFTQGIEVGHIFKLGTKYSKSLDASYLDQKQQAVPMVMGCYGIGVSRIVAAAIEQGHDKDGIIWPTAIAPYAVALVPVEGDDAEVAAAAQSLYDDLWKAGVECLMDDRAERPGIRFKDIDLIGIPLRLVISRKTLQEKQVEFKRRGSAAPERWPLDEAVRRLTALTGEAAT